VAASADSDEVSYRVSVGAFGNADNAQRLAQQFQGAGYPVLLGTQGNLTIVLLGPYATDSEARRVANQVDGTFGVVDPTVYRYEPDDAEAPAATPAPTTTPTTEASAPAAALASPAAIPTPPPVVGADRYLQVGAYANSESAVPQRERLEALGFTVSEVQENGFIKLLLGPYQGTALTDAQSRLAAEGIENFARGL
jgi:cell division protein FtsN